MSLFLSALAMDIAHSGRTNDFEINSFSKISIKYPDESPLEMHHLALFFKILLNTKISNESMKNKETLLYHLNPKDMRMLREFMIHCVLRTDPKFHSHFMDEFTQKKEETLKEKQKFMSFDIKSLEDDYENDPKEPQVIFLYTIIDDLFYTPKSKCIVRNERVYRTGETI